MSTPAEGRSALARFGRFFARHPVLLLFALTPGIPEYLSGSTPMAGLVTAPPVFAIFLALNLGLYGAGVVLVREAWVRLGGGWAALLSLGTAYGLLEEGTALSTLFNPHASVVGVLGSYGRAFGVNWVWTVGVLGVHIVLSVGLPIVLLGLALPETRGRPLLSPRGTLVAAAVYVIDLGILAAIADFYPVEPVAIALAAASAAVLWAVAFRLPRGTFDPPGERPSRGPMAFFLLGLAFYPGLLLVPVLGGVASLPSAVTIGLDLLVAGALFSAVRATIGRRENEPHLVRLALGATLPIAAFGLVSQLGVPVVLVGDALYAAFFVTLYRRYRTAPT